MARNSILVVDDETLMREYVEEALLRAGYQVEAVGSGRDAVAALKARTFDVLVTDLKMAPMDGLELLRHVRAEAPDTRSIVMTAYGTIETAVAALKEGADDYILKPFAPDALEVAVSRALERARIAQENQYLRAELNKGYDFGAMVGDSAAMKKVYEQVARVADSRATVLVRGESGTGKELVARAIHHSGPRRSQAFIKVNCAALSAGLLESELFGHEKGAFTGAHERRIGRFELADGGTLLLDEISEIGIELQPKLLRALQEREFERVGGSTPIGTDARIVATSNRTLEEAVEKGQFREDLFFRLNVIPIHLPPLRERREDIPALLDHFVHRFAQENARDVEGLSPAARKYLLDYDWPGNVRELQNAMERAVVLSRARTLEPEDFSLGGIRSARSPENARVGETGSGALDFVGRTVADMEKDLILHTLEHCGQNRTRAADVLGISIRTLRNKLNEYKL
jgi:DNA-binding NtrC family response regulator